MVVDIWCDVPANLPNKLTSAEAEGNRRHRHHRCCRRRHCYQPFLAEPNQPAASSHSGSQSQSADADRRGGVPRGSSVTSHTQQFIDFPISIKTCQSVSAPAGTGTHLGNAGKLPPRRLWVGLGRDRIMVAVVEDERRARDAGTVRRVVLVMVAPGGEMGNPGGVGLVLSPRT